MRRVVTVVGTRPELIKLSRVIAALDTHFEHVLVHTGQNYDYELNQIFFDQLGIRKPDHFLSAAGATAAETIANVIAKTDQLFAEVAPAALVILGDTNSALCVISAKKRKIPIFHLEAGNRCFDERVPEEVNRRIVDHISDINLVYTEHARRNLLAEGLPPDRIIRTGSPMQEVLAHHAEGIARSAALSTFGLEPQKYFLVSAHREENVDDEDNLVSLVRSLDALSNTYQMPILFSVHPRTQKRLENRPDLKLPDCVRQTKPLGFLDYVALQKQAFCVISDSGTLTEESSMLGFPAIMIRNAHERPEGMDVGTLVMSGLQPERVLEAVSAVTKVVGSQREAAMRVGEYNAPMLSNQIAFVVMSYIDYVNRTVWRRY